MKNKLLVTFAIITLLTCLFAFSVSAEEWFGEVEYLDGILVENHIKSPVTEASLENGELSSAARVKVSCTCEKKEHTFPAYYVTCKESGNTSMAWFNFDDVNAKLTCGGEAMGLENLIAFEFPNGITQIESSLYYQCSEKNLKYLSFERAKTLTKMGNVQSGKNWFSGAPLEVVDIGPYVTNISPWLFYNCKTIESVNIPDNSAITKVGNYAFYGNSSLTSINLPDTVSVIEACAFKGCSSLGAFYIPASLTTFGASGSGQSPIDGCTNLYFVSDKNSTEKPEVYYFPSNVTTVTGEAFKNCYALNDVIVFHSGITSISDGWAFCNTNAIKIVFLGDMQKVSTSGNAWNKSSTLYFCNSADKSTEDLEGINTSAAKFFCTADGNHLYEKTVTVSPTCLDDGGTFELCFCGYKIEQSGVIAATGHATGEVLDKYYEAVNGAPNYFGNMTLVALCENCGEEYSEEQNATALFEARGYSYSEDAADPSISYTIKINGEAIKAFSDSFKYGIVVSASATNAPLTLENGALTHDNKTVIFEMQDAKYAYSIITAKLTNIGAKSLNCSGYAVNGDSIAYLGHDEVNATSEVISYDYIVTTYPSNDE